MRVFIALVLINFIAQVGFAQDVVRDNGRLHLARVVVVDVTVPWTATGINLSPGEKVTIIAVGQAATRLTLSEAFFSGPEGIEGVDPLMPVPNSAQQSLIGKVGSNGTPFYVGRGTSLESQISGQLFLGYNDRQFGDNFGYYVAYVICASCNGVATSIAYESNGALPHRLRLRQNYPNPFNPSTIIEYELPAPGSVQVLVYDVQGRFVRRLLDTQQAGGSHSVTWDGTDDRGIHVASGVYFYQVQAGGRMAAKKAILLK